MRIYRIGIEHKKWGRNWRAEKIAAQSFAKVVLKVKSHLKSQERIESVTLLATEEED